MFVCLRPIFQILFINLAWNFSWFIHEFSEQKYYFQKHQKLKKSSMLYTSVFIIYTQTLFHKMFQRCFTDPLTQRWSWEVHFPFVVSKTFEVWIFNEHLWTFSISTQSEIGVNLDQTVCDKFHWRSGLCSLCQTRKSAYKSASQHFFLVLLLLRIVSQLYI